MQQWGVRGGETSDFQIGSIRRKLRGVSVKAGEWVRGKGVLGATRFAEEVRLVVRNLGEVPQNTGYGDVIEVPIGLGIETLG